MAAASQFPAGNWVNKGQIAELIELINQVVLLGIVANTGETVAVLLTNLTTELNGR